MDVEVCEPLGDAAPREGRVNVYTLPGVESMACVLHRGDFSTVGLAYSALTAWIQANGYRIIGPNREVYLVAVMYQICLLRSARLRPILATDHEIRFIVLLREYDDARQNLGPGRADCGH